MRESFCNSFAIFTLKSKFRLSFIFDFYKFGGSTSDINMANWTSKRTSKSVGLRGVKESVKFMTYTHYDAFFKNYK